MNIKFLLTFVIISLLLSCESNSEIANAKSKFITDLEINFDTENYHLLFKNPSAKELMIVLRTDSVANPDMPVGNVMLKNMQVQPLPNKSFGVYLGNEKEVDKQFKIKHKLDTVSVDIYAYIAKDSIFKLEESLANIPINLVEKVVLRKPTQPSYNLAFSYDQESEATKVMWQKGSGERSILIGKQIVDDSDTELTYPKDGEEFDVADISASGAGIYKSQTFVLFKGENFQDNQFTLKNLNQGRYIFAVLEANGTGESIAYRLPDEKTQGNPRFYVIMPKPPVIGEAKELTANSFLISWSKVEGNQAYKLDLATDPSFQNAVNQYSGFDTGEYNEWMFHDLKPGTKYYLRAKSQTKYGETAYSKVKEISTK